jgi:hypothetical protein
MTPVAIAQFTDIERGMARQRAEVDVRAAARAQGQRAYGRPAPT